MIITVNEFRNILNKDNNFETVKRYKTEYINLALSFDIETTSLYRNKKNHDDYLSNEVLHKLDRKKQCEYEKIAFMYIWQFAFKNYEIIGRDWQSFEFLISLLEKKFNTEYKKKHVVIYVHNLGYEFQFIKNRFNFIDVFAIKERKPIKAITDKGIEFRCSYLLSGYSLATLANNLNSHKIKKLVGDLDYSLIRNSKTELNDIELQYCINDILIVKYYIEECINRFGDISKIPNTQTGIVRKYVRKYTLTSKNYYYHIQRMKLDSESFKALRRAFQGGYTHGNIDYIGKTIKNVFSVDFTSSYPFCLISEKYPITTPILLKCKMTLNAFKDFIKKNTCVFDVELFNVKSKYNINIIAIHKCFKKKNYAVDNGKLIKAEYIQTTVTNIDFDDICYFYSFDNIIVKNIYVFNSGYLPKAFIDCVFKFYNDKTELKNVAGKETEYLHSKEMLNSLYGMCVTDIIRDNINCINGKWITTPVTDIENAIDGYNKDKQRFLFYAWGVFCTSYARHNLFNGLKEMIDKENPVFNDFVYCDTDSIKGINYDKHKQFFDNYNKQCEIKLKKMCDNLGYDYTILYPKTKEGKIKLMGVYDFEGIYQRFKTLGAKRYLYEKNDKCYMTVSGLGKNAINYIGNTNDDKFKNFQNGLYLERGETSKMTHIYCDYEIKGKITDYQNNISDYNEKSFIHLENTDFLMTMQDDYLELIMMYSRMINKVKIT